MKIEQVKTWKMASKVAAVVALGAVASAQSTRGDGAIADVRQGRALTQVSMENDMRSPLPARGKIILTRPDQDQRPLQLQLKMRHRIQDDLGAIMPGIDDMQTTLVLENGTPGGVAVIHLEVRRGGGTKIVGIFDEDGTFQAELPAGFQAHDVVARGEEALVRGAHGGLKVPASKRPTTDDIDVEEAIAQTYLNWARWYAETYTKLQFRTGGGKLRGATLDDDDLSAAAASLAPSRGVGHAQRGKTVDADTESGADEVQAVTPSDDAVRGTGALGKIRLQRPASSSRGPVLGGGHAQPGSGVEDDAETGAPQAVADPADPVGAKRAFGKIQLQRPQVPAQRDDHVLQRKL